MLRRRARQKHLPTFLSLFFHFLNTFFSIPFFFLFITSSHLPFFSNSSSFILNFFDPSFLSFFLKRLAHFVLLLFPSYFSFFPILFVRRRIFFFNLSPHSFSSLSLSFCVSRYLDACLSISPDRCRVYASLVSKLHIRSFRKKLLHFASIRMHDKNSVQYPRKNTEALYPPRVDRFLLDLKNDPAQFSIENYSITSYRANIILDETNRCSFSATSVTKRS